MKNKQLLKESLFNHLVPAYFRILFEIPFHNPLSTTIQSEYVELFQFVKRSLSPLASWTKKKLVMMKLDSSLCILAVLLIAKIQWRLGELPD